MPTVEKKPKRYIPKNYLTRGERRALDRIREGENVFKKAGSLELSLDNYRKLENDPTEDTRRKPYFSASEACWLVMRRRLSP